MISFIHRENLMMHRALRKHCTTFLFLFAFLIPRVADLHALDHFSDDDTISCELCDIAANSQQYDLSTEGIPYEKEPNLNIPFVQVAYSCYNSPLSKIVTPTSVYNKPPPLALIG